MTVTFDALTLSSTFVSGTSTSFSHTVGVGKDALLVVGFAVAQSSSGTTPSSIAATFNSVSLVGTGAGVHNYNNVWCGLLYLTDPDMGSSYTVAPSWSGTTGNSHGRCFAASFHGVDQYTPLKASSLTTLASLTDAPSISVPSLIGGMVVDAISRQELFGGGTQLDSAGSGQTEIMKGSIQNNIRNGHGASYESPTAVTTTMDWSVTGTRDTAQMGICFQPSTSGGVQFVAPAHIMF